MDATGTLAFLQVNVTDDATDPSHFDGRFTVDLIDPGSQSTDGRLSFSELQGASASSVVNATLSAAAALTRSR